MYRDQMSRTRAQEIAERRVALNQDGLTIEILRDVGGWSFVSRSEDELAAQLRLRILRAAVVEAIMEATKLE